MSRTLMLAGKIGPAFKTLPGLAGAVVVEVVGGNTVSCQYTRKGKENAVDSVFYAIAEEVENMHLPCGRCAICVG